MGTNLDFGERRLGEKIFILYVRDLLRPHNINNPFSMGINCHKSNNGRIYYNYRNRRNKIEAEKFFRINSPEFRFWCDVMDITPTDILTIVKFCVDNNKDRLYGKRALQAFFKQHRGES